MHDGIPRPHVFGQPAAEVLMRQPDVKRPRAVVEDLMHGKEASLRLVHLSAVVGQRAVERMSYCNFGNHCSRNSFVRSMIRRFSAAISTVCFSSL